MNNNVKKIVGIIVGTVFIATMYYIPESFTAFFAAGLFLVPTTFFVLMIQKMAEEEENGKGEYIG